MKILTILMKDKNLKKLNYNMDIINTVGRRKTSKARVFLTKGKGNISVNKKELADYFPREVAQMLVKQP